MTAAAGAPILVFGSLNLDIVINMPRLPAPGDTVLASRMTTMAGGKGANQAVAAARAGGRVRMAGRVGADDDGAQLLAALDRDGVDRSGVVVDAAAGSGRAVVMVDDAGSNQIVVVPGANGRAVWDAGLLAGAAAAVLVVQLEVPVREVAAALRDSRAAGWTSILNAAPATGPQPELMATADVVVCNAGEAAALLGGAGADVADAERSATGLLAQGPRAAVVTLGGEGAVVATSSRVARQAAFPVDAVDTTAAGDAFVGVLAVALAEGTRLEDAVRMASAAGALTASKRGSQPSLPRRHDVVAFLRVPRA